MKAFTRLTFGALALVGSSIVSAASLNVTSSKSNPGMGEVFTVSLKASGFYTDTVAEIAMKLSFNASVVRLQNASLPASGPLAIGTGTFFVDINPLFIWIPGSGNANGDFDVGVFTFEVIGEGAANIAFSDDGGIETGWYDYYSELIPVTYNNPTVFIGSPAPEITVKDSVAPINDLTVPFGSVNVGLSAPQTVTITNSGYFDLIVGTLTNPAAPFSLANDLCSGQTLAFASDCTVDVVFAPAASGAASSSFDIPSNDADENLVTVAVSGIGAPDPVSGAAVTDSVSPANDLLVPFGNMTVGQTGTQTVTVTNSGNANLVLDTVAVANPLAAPFAIANDNCSGQTVAPTTNCTFQVQFQPTTFGTFNDDLDIPTNDPDDPVVTVSVGGTNKKAFDDFTATGISEPVQIDVLKNDTGLAASVFVGIWVDPVHGSASVSGAPGAPSGIRITYTPDPGFVGPDSFEYWLESGLIVDYAKVTVNMINYDLDDDGVSNALDNCTLVANPNQCDSDGDGYGNSCDGDLTNNGFTNAQDYVVFRTTLGAASIAPTYNVGDLNCNGFVNAQDYVLFRHLLGKSPGPSWLVP